MSSTSVDPTLAIVAAVAVVLALVVIPAVAAMFVADRSRRDTVELSKAVLMLKGLNPHHLKPEEFAPNGASWDALNREAEAIQAAPAPEDPDLVAEREEQARQVEEFEELQREAREALARVKA